MSFTGNATYSRCLHQECSGMGLSLFGGRVVPFSSGKVWQLGRSVRVRRSGSVLLQQCPKLLALTVRGPACLHHTATISSHGIRWSAGSCVGMFVMAVFACARFMGRACVDNARLQRGRLAGRQAGRQAGTINQPLRHSLRLCLVLLYVRGVWGYGSPNERLKTARAASDTPPSLPCPHAVLYRLSAGLHHVQGSATYCGGGQGQTVHVLSGTHHSRKIIWFSRPVCSCLPTVYYQRRCTKEVHPDYAEAPISLRDVGWSLTGTHT